MPTNTTDPTLQAAAIAAKPVMLFHYTSDTQELLYSAMSDTDPIEGLPLIPSFATDVVAPKTIKKGFVAVFDVNKKTWTQVEDHRGDVFDTSTGEKSTHAALGALPAGKTSIAPADTLRIWDAATGAWLLDINKVRADKLATIKTDYNALLYANITVPSLSADFQADTASQAAIDACINRLTNGWKPPVGADQWLDTANGSHPITLQHMNAIANAIATRKAQLFLRYQTAKAKVATAKTVAAVNKVVL